MPRYHSFVRWKCFYHLKLVNYHGVYCCTYYLDVGAEIEEPRVRQSTKRLEKEYRYEMHTIPVVAFIQRAYKA